MDIGFRIGIKMSTTWTYHPPGDPQAQSGYIAVGRI